jgi:hypothetical protein
MEGQLPLYKKKLAYEIKNIPEEYLPNLVQIVRLFRESVTLQPAEESFRRGWKECLSGETHPLSGLWDGIDAD